MPATDSHATHPIPIILAAERRILDLRSVVKESAIATTGQRLSETIMLEQES
ncbi:hypothetical protein [Rhodopseudomonas pseudopalustris]|uniref:hypothetical protein n=1 Tax=Rhodopseudomonas pseudopalustris TaxID=1513892 RepID=UPI0002E8AA4B|nr:hypothetical protein [Rhodopseudomonas pseudopalustris]